VSVLSADLQQVITVAGDGLTGYDVSDGGEEQPGGSAAPAQLTVFRPAVFYLKSEV